jgi:cytochrome c oxidase assembly protein subunit 17
VFVRAVGAGVFAVIFMGQAQSTEAAPPAAGKTPTCKICCACPEERRARDECYIFKGAEGCKQQIDAFYKCLLREGFTQDQVDSLRKSVKQ